MSDDNGPSYFEAVFWVVTVLGCLAGGAFLALTFVSSGSAPQQAAGAAMACGCAVVPYCLARAVRALAGR